MKSILDIIKTKKNHSSDSSGAKSKLSYKIVEINFKNREVIIINCEKNETFKKCYIIIELPTGEYISGPYDNIVLAEKDFLNLTLAINIDHR